MDVCEGVTELRPREQRDEVRRRSVLLVDDDDLVRSALLRTLGSSEYDVLAVSSGEGGLAMLRSRPIDVVVSDHLMPEMTGLEFLKKVRDRFPDSLRIMLTGHAEAQVAMDAINQGEIYRFITKPWDNTELRVMLYTAFEQLELQREHRRLLSMMRTGQLELGRRRASNR